MRSATIDDVKQAWAKLIGVLELTKLHVIVDPNSRIAPPGWVGLLAIDDTLTVCVPTIEFEKRVGLAVSGLDPIDATTPGVILPKLPPTLKVLGPARLFYNFGPGTPDTNLEVESVPRTSLSLLIDSVPNEELKESGITEIEDALVIRSGRGDPIAACGYRVWPNGVANICVLVHPDYRGLGYAYSLATATIVRVEREGLLAQWRARPESSRKLALRLGLIEVGAQLSLEMT